MVSDDSSSSIAHLRSGGSFLHKSSGIQHIVRFESKGNPVPRSKTTITAAYGAQKCPKIVGLLSDPDAEVVTQALKALCAMLKLPTDVVMCIKAGVVPKLENIICGVGSIPSTEDQRELAAKAIEQIASESSGRRNLLTQNTAVTAVLIGLKDESSTVRKSCLGTSIKLSSTSLDAAILTDAGYIQACVPMITSEMDDELRAMTLKLLKNCLNDSNPESVGIAVELGAIEAALTALYDPTEAVRETACAALAQMCFTEEARNAAIEKEAVERLVPLLMDDNWNVSSASASALMTLSVNDDAKRQMVSTGGVKYLSPLLNSSKFAVQLNTLKLISNVAQYPPAKAVLNEKDTLHTLRLLVNDNDRLISKAAKVALNVVLWKA